MLEFYFKSPTWMHEMRCGILGEHFDNFAVELSELEYARFTARHILMLMGKFSRFAQAAGVNNAKQIDEVLVARFLNEKLPSEGAYKDAPNAMRHMMEHLRRRRVIPAVAPTQPKDSFVDVIEGYCGYLLDVRGLMPSSQDNYQRYARRLLTWLQDRRDHRPLKDLNGVDVIEYITELADLHPSGAWRHGLCSTTRVFLRYLRWEGIIEEELDRVVPTVPYWRLVSIPRHLPWKQVRTLIDSVDTSTPIGKRDKAVLLLIARLGLRNQEARTLQFVNVAWRAAEIRLSQTKTRRERVVPLPQDVGDAIADYVLHGRPHVDVPYVFVRHQVPRGPLTTSHGIGDIVRRHLQRAGLSAPSYGAYLLRHSLATRMVNRGVPIKEVADTLGHVSIDTTAIYTKVDTTSLAAVAMPFPGGDA